MSALSTAYDHASAGENVTADEAKALIDAVHAIAKRLGEEPEGFLRAHGAWDGQESTIPVACVRALQIGGQMLRDRGIDVREAVAGVTVLPTAKTATKTFGEVVDLRNAYSAPPPPRDDVIIGAEPGEVVTLGAPGGAGKSMFTLSLVHDLAVGGSVEAVRTTLVPGGKPQSSLVLSAEESVAETVRRVHRIGAFLTPDQRERAARAIEVRSMKREVPILIDAGGAVNVDTRDEIERAAEGRRFVVIDPLGRFVRAEKDEAAMVTLVTTLEGVAQRVGCVFFVLHHVGKAAIMAGNGDSALAMKGSTALSDSCRMACMLFRPPTKVAKERGIQARWFRILKVDKANNRADKDEVWFAVRANGTLEYSAHHTEMTVGGLHETALRGAIGEVSGDRATIEPNEPAEVSIGEDWTIG